MDPDEDADLALAIPIKNLLEEFQCPICFNSIKEAYITACGHNFCKACILECLNRKHQCPCCNHAAVKENTVKNHHLDKLVAIVQSEKKEAERKYFEKLFKQKALSSSAGADNNGTSTSVTKPSSPITKEAGNKQSALSPIEELFHKHTKKSLGAYQEYCRDLRQRVDKQIETLHKDYAMKMVLAGGSEPKLFALKQECDSRVTQIQQGYDDQMKLLLEAYDKYMNDFAAKPLMLPVSVSVAIPQKSILLSNIVVTANATPKELRELVRERLAHIGNPLITWVPSNIFVWKKDTNEEIVLDDNVPISIKKVEPGAVLEIKGEVQLQRDAPKSCFAFTFKPGDKMDYFHCKNCNMNWVCKACMEVCHKGHELSPYLSNHAPTWGCCYCTKNKKCTLPPPKK